MFITEKTEKSSLLELATKIAYNKISLEEIEKALDFLKKMHEKPEPEKEDAPEEEPLEPGKGFESFQQLLKGRHYDDPKNRPAYGVVDLFELIKKREEIFRRARHAKDYDEALALVRDLDKLYGAGIALFTPQSLAFVPEDAIRFLETGERGE